MDGTRCAPRPLVSGTKQPQAGCWAVHQQEESMRIKFLVAAASIVALTTPALADYYIVQDSSTKRCSIVEQRPTTQTSVVVGDSKVYTSRTEAEGAMKTVK